MQSELIVHLKNVQVVQNTNPILANITISLAKSEFAYLIGKTGSGKSSLLKLIYGDLPLSVGEGTVAGFDLRQLNRKQIPFLRRKLGIVFQDFNLLNDRTVGENLLFVLRATDWKDTKAMYERVNIVLNEVGLPNAYAKMPHQLSGGEQQRVVIARALLNSPQLIIADEPTGNLDPETSDEILQLLRSLALRQQTAILFATHDYRILQQFPARVIRCANGEVLEEENFTY